MDNATAAEAARALSADTLRQFTGSEEFFRHELMRDVVYTSGIHYVAVTAHAFWLIDIVASCQHDPFVKAEEFQVWRLFVNPDKTARVDCGDGNGKTVYQQDIEYTDFPLEEGITFWFANNTICLPSEY
jgi:hypothetical protein